MQSHGNYNKEKISNNMLEIDISSPEYLAILMFDL